MSSAASSASRLMSSALAPKLISESVMTFSICSVVVGSAMRILSLRSGGQSAIDVYGAAGDVAGALGRQEGDRRGDLLRRAGALCRHLLAKHIRDVLGHVRRDQPRGHRVDRHPT